MHTHAREQGSYRHLFFSGTTTQRNERHLNEATIKKLRVDFSYFVLFLFFSNYTHVWTHKYLSARTLTPILTFSDVRCVCIVTSEYVFLSDFFLFWFLFLFIGNVVEFIRGICFDCSQSLWVNHIVSQLQSAIVEQSKLYKWWRLLAHVYIHACRTQNDRNVCESGAKRKELKSEPQNPIREWMRVSVRVKLVIPGTNRSIALNLLKVAQCARW